MTRRPTTYKASYEQELHRRQHLERRVEAMQQEIDALKWRLHVAEVGSPDPKQRPRFTYFVDGGSIW